MNLIDAPLIMHEAHFIEGAIGHLRTSLPTQQAFDEADWSLRVITREADFDQLEESWNELVQHSACTVFQDFVWLRTWWRHHARAKETRLHIVVIARDGNVVAIAPFYIERVRLFGFVPLTCLRFLGRRHSDYLDVIIRHGAEKDEVYAQLARHLVVIRRQWDFALLEDIPHRSASLTMLLEAAHRVGLNGTAEVNEQCPSIILPQSWEEYVRRLSKKERHECRRRERKLREQYVHRLSKKERHECRRRERKLRERFQAEFETITDERELGHAFEDFVALHQQGWSDRGEPGVFAESATLAFHREVIGELFRRGYVRLGFLRLAGQRVAGTYAFVYGATHALYLLGMSGRHCARSLSPGIVMCCYNIRQAIEEGRRVFDFMRGVEHYKYALAAHDEPNWTLTLYAARRKWFLSTHRLRDAVVLWESLQHRVGKELWRLRRAVRNEGWFSSETVKQFIRSCVALIRDGIRKSHAPLQPLYLRTAQGERAERDCNGIANTNVSRHNGGSTRPVHSPKPIRADRSRVSQ